MYYKVVIENCPGIKNKTIERWANGFEAASYAQGFVAALAELNSTIIIKTNAVPQLDGYLWWGNGDLEIKVVDEYGDIFRPIDLKDNK